MDLDAAADRPRSMAFVVNVAKSTTFVGRPAVDRLILLRARCKDPRGSYNTLFHSDDPRDIARAKAICARCTVREVCLTRALERHEPCGVWGGEILYEGVVVPHRPRRGRRPKNFGIPIEVDEITGLPCEPVADAV